VNNVVWLNGKGVRPSSQFPASIARQGVFLYNPGENDNYFTNYGMWWSSQLIPVNSDGSIDFCNQGGNPGTLGYVYMSIRGYSIPTASPLANINSGAQLIIWQPFVTPLTFEWTYTSSATQTISLAGVPSGARYVLADLFVSETASDHCVYCQFSRQEWTSSAAFLGLTVVFASLNVCGPLH
jgi:hypothetical protein